MSPLQGPRRNDGGATEGNHHGPGKRTLLRVVLADKEMKPTARAVERLMGTKAEARFEFIQENAEFASEELLDVDRSRRRCIDALSVSQAVVA